MTPTVPYDISRIASLKRNFPAGFTVESHPAKALHQQDIDSSDVHVFSTAEVDPPRCRSLLLPAYADPSVGSRAAAIRAENEQGSMYVIALVRPRPVPVTEPPADCDAVTVLGSPGVTGTANRIAAPKINGTTTTAVKLGFDDGSDPDYIFTAALNDQTAVVVIGSTEPELGPEQMLSDLLVAAAAAVRGQ